MAGLFTVGVGFAFTTMLPLAAAVHPHEPVAVTEYVPATVLRIVLVVSPELHA
jgi:hypothetical protein